MRTPSEVKFVEEDHIRDLLRSVQLEPGYTRLTYRQTSELAEKIRKYMKKREHERTRIRGAI